MKIYKKITFFLVSLLCIGHCVLNARWEMPRSQDGRFDIREVDKRLENLKKLDNPLYPENQELKKKNSFLSQQNKVLISGWQQTIQERNNLNKILNDLLDEKDKTRTGTRPFAAISINLFKLQTENEDLKVQLNKYQNSKILTAIIVILKKIKLL